METLEIPWLRRTLGRMVFALHLFSVLFLITGCFWPLPFLKIQLIAIPLVILQWFLNGSHCVLTQIQHKLEGRVKASDEEGQFVQELFSKIGFHPPRRQLMFIIYFVLILNWVVSFYRVL